MLADDLGSLGPDGLIGLHYVLRTLNAEPTVRRASAAGRPARAPASSSATMAAISAARQADQYSWLFLLPPSCQIARKSRMSWRALAAIGQTGERCTGGRSSAILYQPPGFLSGPT